MKKCLLIKISGKVQGVGFRMNAKHQADILKLTGRVRNEPDGSVSIEAQGEESDLQKFIGWCKEGSPSANVISLTIKEISDCVYADFSVDMV